MPDKKKKKPRHLKLVVPGESKRSATAAKDRLGRTAPPAATQAATPTPANAAAANEAFSAAPAAGTTAQGEPAGPLRESAPEKKSSRFRLKKSTGAAAATGAPAPAAQEATLPPNAILLPQKPRKKKKPLSPVKRRRLRRRIRAVVVLVLAVAVVGIYASGAYITAFARATDRMDTLRIAARGGEGFPISLSLSGLLKAEPMGGNGFAALTESSLVIVSENGRELHRVQHAWLSPGISAGQTRAVLYARGGTEYTVTGRDKTITKQNTQQELQFCEISPDGHLAVVTASRYRSTLTILGLDYNTADPLFTWPLVDDKPILARFHSDNRSLALGCVYAASDGSVGSVLYLVRSNADKVQAEIRVHGSVLVNAAYLDNHRVLAVFDTHTALYNERGEELARYGYSGRRLLSSDVSGGVAALAFGVSGQDTQHAVLLDDRLSVRADIAYAGGDTPGILAVPNGFFLLSGQDVLAYTATGALAGTLTMESKALALVNGGEPLALAASEVQPLAHLMANPPPAQSASSQSGADATSTQSAAVGSTASTLPGSSGEADASTPQDEGSSLPDSGDAAGQDPAPQDGGDGTGEEGLGGETPAGEDPADGTPGQIDETL